MKITKTIVERVTYEGKPYVAAGGRTVWPRHVLWDEAIPGFGGSPPADKRPSYSPTAPRGARG
jgi:hypothetical protein